MTTTQTTTHQLIATLNGLYAAEAAGREADSDEPLTEPRVIATYHNGQGQFRFAIAMDLALANSLGAALTMIPPGGAEDATAAGEVPDNIAENLHEVMNICSAIFADAEHDRIVLDQLYRPGQIPDEIQDALEVAETLSKIEYALPRYQAGRMNLLKINA